MKIFLVTCFLIIFGLQGWGKTFLVKTEDGALKQYNRVGIPLNRVAPIIFINGDDDFFYAKGGRKNIF